MRAIDGECGVYACPVEEDGRHDEEDYVAHNENGNGAVQVGHVSLVFCEIEDEKWLINELINVENGELTGEPALNFAETGFDDVRWQVLHVVEYLADENDNERNTPGVNRVENDPTSHVLTPVSRIARPQVTKNMKRNYLAL